MHECARTRTGPTAIRKKEKRQREKANLFGPMPTMCRDCVRDVFYLCGVRLCVKLFHPHVYFEFQVPKRVCHVEQRCVYARMHIYR